MSVVIPWTGIALTGYAVYAQTEGCSATTNQACMAAGGSCGNGAGTVDANASSLPQCTSVVTGGDTSCGTTSGSCTYVCTTVDAGKTLGVSTYNSNVDKADLGTTSC